MTPWGCFEALQLKGLTGIFLVVGLIMTADFILDPIRGPHLLAVVVGMGTALYSDLRTLHKISRPLSTHDLDEVRRIHFIVTLAFVGIWASGVGLIWYRTEFVLEVFSPKLWSKMIVVTVLTANAIVLAAFVLPSLKLYVGTPLITLPRRVLAPMSIVAGVSAACWVLALTLGFSKVLKTAPWDVLIPFLMTGFAVGIGGSVLMVFGLRFFDRKAQQNNP